MQAPERFRIVTYNVRYFSHAAIGLGSTRSSRRRIAAALASLSPPPDLICLQEVETRSLRSRIGRPAKRRGQTQLEAFLDDLGEECRARGRSPSFEAFYFGAHVYRLLRANLYTTGLAVLVDRGRLAVEGHNAAGPDRITHHGLDPELSLKQARICAHLLLSTPRGRRLHLFNTHVSLPTPFERGFWKREDRMGHGPNQLEEARNLAACVRRLAGKEPFLLCGDFNSPPGSPVYRFLTEEAGCVGAQEALGRIDASNPRGHPTAGFLAYRMHLDHLFAGGGVRWVDVDGTQPYGRGPFHGLSDHVPLLAQLEVGG